MENFRVPQREVEVEVHLLDSRNLSGRMYVPALGPDGQPGHLIDRLNSDSEEFLPMRVGPEVHLVHENRILTIQVGHDEVEENVEKLIEDSSMSCHHWVRIHLSSGIDIAGHLYYLQPPDNARLQDYLNTERRFIPLHGDDGLVYVNRDHIVSMLSLSGDDTEDP